MSISIAMQVFVFVCVSLCVCLYVYIRGFVDSGDSVFQFQGSGVCLGQGSLLIGAWLVVKRETVRRKS